VTARMIGVLIVGLGLIALGFLLAGAGPAGAHPSPSPAPGRSVVTPFTYGPPRWPRA
jgi:hypothetical protein